MTKRRKHAIIRKSRGLSDDKLMESCLALTRIFFGQEDEKMARNLYRVARLTAVKEERKHEDRTETGSK